MFNLVPLDFKANRRYLYVSAKWCKILLAMMIHIPNSPSCNDADFLRNLFIFESAKDPNHLVNIRTNNLYP